MRDLNINELEQVYGAGGSSCGCGSSPTPPSRGSKGKASKAKNSGSKHSKANNRGSKGYC